MNRHELPQYKPLRGTVYERNDPRVKNKQPLQLRGVPSRAQLLEHVQPSERALLESAHLTIACLLNFGGAISSRGQILQPQVDPESHPPFEKYQRTEFVQRYGMDISNPRSAKPYICVWTQKLKERYFSRRFKADSVLPIAISDEGERTSLEPLVRSFAAFIRLRYKELALDPSVNLKGVARSFIIEILEKLHEEWLQQHGSLQSPQKQ